MTMLLLLTLTLTLALAGPAAAETRTATGALIYDVLPHRPTELQIRAYAALERSRDRGAIPVLIELLRFDLPVPEAEIWVLLTLPQFCFAFAGAGRVLGVDRWLEPALRARAAAGAGWAALVHQAT
jgi:hypothetical protein